ncbi:hypothetical protein NC651_011239 [Populus alba x Populus x berolinensis]|nr:hypothetical protein NC651_011239 [Populus alba x Populus x berolinensis]
MKANGVVDLQMRQPSPCFQRLKDFAIDFVFDGFTSEDKSRSLLTPLGVV